MAEVDEWHEPLPLRLDRYPFTPDYAVPPSQTLRELMNHPEYPGRTLATALRMTFCDGCALICEDWPITPAIAVRLAEVFGPSADFWLNLEANYCKDLQRLEAKDTSAPKSIIAGE